MANRNLTIVTDDGKELLCEILFTYHSEDTKKDYVVFRVVETNEISAACYTESTTSTGDLNKIETDEEWEMLEDLLDEYYEKNNCDGNCSGCAGCPGSDSDEE